MSFSAVSSRSKVFLTRQAYIESLVIDTIRDQLNRRQGSEMTSRNVLRLMIATCGFAEVRVMATQRLELWLSNQKVCFRFRYIFGKARCNKRFDLCR